VSTKVLLVEDDTRNLAALTIYLKIMGVQVEQAHDGFEALQKLDQDTFHIVVSDLRMPGLNGLELAKRVHQRLDGVPVVLITGDPIVPSLSALEDSDVFELLVKPFMPSELIKIIRRALGDREL
jgi:two-component system C4-dicarboxylate transport response regulator DctD